MCFKPGWAVDVVVNKTKKGSDHRNHVLQLPDGSFLLKKKSRGDM